MESLQAKRRRPNHFCCVPQCTQYSAPGISFHHFPRNPKLKKEWETKLRMGKPVSEAMLVCSKHFLATDFFPSSVNRKKLFPHSFPSQNLPQRSHDRQHSSRERKQNKAMMSKEIIGDSSESSTLSENVEEISETSESSIPKCSPATVQVNLADFRQGRTGRYDETTTFADILSNYVQNEKTTQVNLLPVWEDDNNCNCATNIALPALLESNEKLFTFTGVHSLELLNGIVDCVQELALEGSTKKKIISVKDRVILTMVKIKQNMCFTAIGVLFGISRQTCSNYFKNMCLMLARVLQVFIPWPDQDTIRSNLPWSFHNFKNTRIILDCCEVPLEKFKCLKCRILTYSQYKKKHTIKFHIGVTPSGLITECSKAFGGRASDKLIVAKSGILGKLDFNDAIMVDKGYHIEKECMEHNIKLLQPPFLRNAKQLSEEEALHCAEIARARVHIERVFQRMRQYQLLCGPVPLELPPYFDDILKIVSGLTNLGPPVIGVEKFM